MVQRNGGRGRRKAKEAERQRKESSLGSDGFADKTGGKQVAALDSSNSSIGQGRFRAGPTDDIEDPRLPSKRIDFGGKRRREMSAVRRHDVPDDTRGNLDKESARRRKF